MPPVMKKKSKRIQSEREVMMEKVFQGALAVIAKHKAAKEAPPEPKPVVLGFKIQPRRKPTL